MSRAVVLDPGRFTADRDEKEELRCLCVLLHHCETLRIFLQ